MNKIYRIQAKQLLLSFFLLLSGVFLFSDGYDASSNKKGSVEDFFKMEPFSTMKEKLVLNDRELLVSVHYIDKNKIIFDKAVFYEHTADGDIIHLYLHGKAIYDTNSQKIIDFVSYDDIIGFSVIFAYPTDPSYEIGVEFFAYFSDKLNKSDPIGIDWDNELKKFHLFVLSNYEH